MATRFASARTPAGYDEDFALWSTEQAGFLRAGQWDALDLDNIAEEIEGLAKSDRRELKSRLQVVCEHLIKLRCSSDHDPRAGWWTSIREARNRMADVLDDSPSLRRELPALMEQVWPRAEREAVEGLRRREEQVLAKLIGRFLDAEGAMHIDDNQLRALANP